MTNALITTLGETVTVLRAGSTLDPYSQEVDDADWTAPTSIPTIALCEPRPASESTTDDRHAVIGGWTLYMPAGADVTAHDRVIIRGITHEILGDPADWRLGATTPGVVVQCQRVSG